MRRLVLCPSYAAARCIKRSQYPPATLCRTISSRTAKPPHTSSLASGSAAPFSASSGDYELARFRRHLIRLAWPERRRLAGGIVLLAGSSSISVVFPKVMGHVMDSCLAAASDAWTPATAAGALLILFGAQSAMVATRGRILAVSAERVAARLRRETFASLLRHDMSFFDLGRSGELQSRLSSDCSSRSRI